jgi:hypothetical protein
MITMTLERLRELIAMTGDQRPTLAHLLGYNSENSLRQCESGKASLPPEKAEWLERYATMRARQDAVITDWLQKNPAPGSKVC